MVESECGLTNRAGPVKAVAFETVAYLDAGDSCLSGGSGRHSCAAQRAFWDASRGHAGFLHGVVVAAEMKATHPAVRAGGHSQASARLHCCHVHFSRRSGDLK
eukprot:365942-Chlamydomonas_euryale.AAC.10